MASQPQVLPTEPTDPDPVAVADKPGWKTTEFWYALIAQVFAILILTGVISAGDAASLEDALSKASTNMVGLVGAAWIIVRYIQGRIATKGAALDYQARIFHSLRTTEVTAPVSASAVEDYTQGLQRYMSLSGITVEPIHPLMSKDNRKAVEKAIQADISIETIMEWIKIFGPFLSLFIDKLIEKFKK